MPAEDIFNVDSLLKYLEPPVLILSSKVGRGTYSIGEAFKERFFNKSNIYHLPVEEFLPQQAVNEDAKRYKIISDKFRFLLHLIYKIPFFYHRKYLREKIFNKSDLQSLKKKIECLDIKTVICISHRPAFWVSNLKRREKMDFKIWGILVEYGKNLGWKYIFWEVMDGFVSPLERKEFDFNFPPHLKFLKTDLPVRSEFYEISKIKGDKNKVLLMCGFWGQGPLFKILKLLSKDIPQLNIYALCGENVNAYKKIKLYFKDNPNIKVYNVVESWAPFLKECACVITKPGFATLSETQAARRKIFLLKGMPVAEDNNARFAIENFGAQWFKLESFKRWYAGFQDK